eukprot:1178172-Prorocentrum_minimum.AAC.5
MRSCSKDQSGEGRGNIPAAGPAPHLPTRRASSQTCGVRPDPLVGALLVDIEQILELVGGRELAPLLVAAREGGGILERAGGRTSCGYGDGGEVGDGRVGSCWLVVEMGGDSLGKELRGEGGRSRKRGGKRRIMVRALVLDKTLVAWC